MTNTMPGLSVNSVSKVSRHANTKGHGKDLLGDMFGGTAKSGMEGVSSSVESANIRPPGSLLSSNMYDCHESVVASRNRQLAE